MDVVVNTFGNERESQKIKIMGKFMFSKMNGAINWVAGVNSL